MYGTYTQYEQILASARYICTYRACVTLRYATLQALYTHRYIPYMRYKQTLRLDQTRLQTPQSLSLVSSHPTIPPIHPVASRTAPHRTAPDLIAPYMYVCTYGCAGVSTLGYWR